MIHLYSYRVTIIISIIIWLESAAMNASLQFQAENTTKQFIYSAIESIRNIENIEKSS